MKRYKTYCFGSKTYKGYFFSLISIAFLGIILVSLIMIRHLSDNMKKEELRIAENKIHTILEDLENQEKVMKDMAVKFSSYPKFHLENGDKVKDIEILEGLKDYNFISGISESFFLKYQSVNEVYYSNGTVMPLEIFVSDKLRMDANQELINLLKDEKLGKMESTLAIRVEQTIFFIFPLKIYTASRKGTAEYLCVVSSEDKVYERIENFVGTMTGNLIIYFNDVCIYGDTIQIDDSMIDVISSRGSFCINYQMKSNEYFTLRNIFSVKETATFLTIAVIIIVLAILVASWNFRPIKRIAERYANVIDEKVSDWGDVEQMIDSLLDMKEKKQEVLQDRYSKLREQVVQLVVAGEYSYKLENFMTLLNIKWNASYFGLIKCIFNDKVLTLDRGEEIRKGIEGLSGDGLYLYPHKEDDGVWNVLVAAEESYQLEETMELLQSVFEIMDLSADMELTSKGSDLKELCRKEAESTLVYSNVMDAEVLLPEEAELDDENKAGSKKESGPACQIAAYIKEHCTDYNISLELVAQEFQITTSYLCRIIKQQVGMSYKEYLTELRIAEAKRLLMEEELSVTEVCMRVGYTNASNFIRVFQKYTGMTPAKFRDSK